MPSAAPSEMVQLTPAPAAGSPGKPAGASPPPPPAPPAGPSLDAFDEEFDLHPDDLRDLEAFRARHADKPAEAPEEIPDPEPPPVAHPARLARHAKELGFTDDEVKALSTADLRAEVDREVRMRALKAPPREEPRREAAPPPKPAPEPAPEEDLLDEFGVERDAFDEVTQKQLTAMLRRVKDRIESAAKDSTERLGRLEQIEAARANEQDWLRLDRFFAEHEGVYGKGPSGQIDPDSPEAARRLAVYRELVEKVKSGKHGKFRDDLEAVHERLYGFAPKAAGDAANPLAAAYPGGNANGVRGGEPQPRDPDTNKFVKADPKAAEREERRRAWMGSASPAPTDRTEADLPPGQEKAMRGVQRRLGMLGKADATDGT